MKPKKAFKKQIAARVKTLLILGSEIQIAAAKNTPVVKVLR